MMHHAAGTDTGGSGIKAMHKRRQLTLLASLVDAAKGRTDIDLRLSEHLPTIGVQHYAGGIRFVDKDDPQFEAGSDLAYDLNTLKEQGLIAPASVSDGKQVTRDSRGHIPQEWIAVRVSPDGIEAIVEHRKSWIRKAIDKQPINAVQFAWGVALVAASFVSWWIGRVTAPAPSPEAATITKESDPSKSLPPAGK